MLEKVKFALRIQNTLFDDEVQDIIDACLLDLELSGVNIPIKTENDKLITRSIILYAKSEFGLASADSEKYKLSYEALKRHLTLSEEYTK